MTAAAFVLLIGVIAALCVLHHTDQKAGRSTAAELQRLTNVRSELQRDNRTLRIQLRNAQNTSRGGW